MHLQECRPISYWIPRKFATLAGTYDAVWNSDAAANLLDKQHKAIGLPASMEHLCEHKQGSEA